MLFCSLLLLNIYHMPLLKCMHHSSEDQLSHPNLVRNFTLMIDLLLRHRRWWFDNWIFWMFDACLDVGAPGPRIIMIPKSVFTHISLQRNILLDYHLSVKLTDFGMSTFVDANSASGSSTKPGLARWPKPETINPQHYGLSNKVRATRETDIFDFAGACWEVCLLRFSRTCHLMLDRCMRENDPLQGGIQVKCKPSLI